MAATLGAEYRAIICLSTMFVVLLFSLPSLSFMYRKVHKEDKITVCNRSALLTVFHYKKNFLSITQIVSTWNSYQLIKCEFCCAFLHQAIVYYNSLCSLKLQARLHNQCVF